MEIKVAPKLNELIENNKIDKVNNTNFFIQKFLIDKIG